MIKKYLSAFVAGFGAGVLQVVPVAKSFSCCLIIPAAVFIALLLDRRANRITEKTTTRRAITIGVLTGLYAALFGSFFDIFITLVTKNNDIIAAFPELQKMILSFPVSEAIKTEVLKLFESVRSEILNSGFSPLYTFSVLVNNFIIDTIFGLIGGLIGVQIVNARFSAPRE